MTKDARDRRDNARVAAFVLLAGAAWLVSRWLRAKSPTRRNDDDMPDDARDGRDRQENAGVVAPPPLIFGVPLIVTLLSNRRTKLGLLPGFLRGIGKPVGWTLVVLGLILGFWFLRQMRRADTPVDPYKPVSNLTTDGPFAYTRNPAYLGMTLIYAGAMLAGNSLPSALALPVVLYVMNRGVIEREEEYLERLFGGEYRAYRAQVGRWI